MGWNTQAVIAQLVIIEGANDMLLVYSGTPAAGNLIASIANQQTTDSFGNNVDAGITTYNNTTGGTVQLNGAEMRLAAGTKLFFDMIPTALLMYAGSGGALGQLLASISQGSGVIDVYGNSSVKGLGAYNIAADLAVAIQNNLVAWFSEPGGANGAGPWTQVGSIAGTASGITVNTLPLTSTAGTASAPTLITTDTWNSLGTLSNYTVNIGKYRLTTSNQLELDINVTSSAGAAGSTSFSVTLPAAYRPVTNHTALPMGTTKAIAAADVWPRLSVTTAGAVTVVNNGGTTNQYTFNGTISIDN